ncbi:tRNA (adenosine(37)-N6)-threonylcarbamoyltransferase complex ATPase subunit type 1 TsaE [candidate division KSB1 bacterium]|nr:tRNA (adenosine(37)-N6)-threonylcarbamoyltransferase complex ATPase subunit type 1 TsaE [candidate division KSB1 bacterium]
MSTERITTHSVAETLVWAEGFAKTLQPGAVLALTGELGAGKTVVAKGIGRGLGVTAEIISPTFNYILEYTGRLPFIHGDMYRLAGAATFVGMGFAEYLDRGGVVVLEWAERVREVLPPNTIWLTLVRVTEQERLITVHRPSL